MSKKARTHSNKLGREVSEPKGPSTSSSVLSRIFRNMTVDLGLSALSAWDRLMNQYINDARNCVPRNKKDQSSARGNLQKELLKPEMTWKVFLKGIRFLGIISFEINIIAKHANGKQTIHSHSVNLGTPVMLPPIENEQPSDTSNQPRL